MRNLNEKDREFYKKMIFIGFPVVIQNMISIGLNLLDTLMIGRLGEEQLAAVGAANQVYFIFTVSLFGLFSGAAVHTSQYFGAGDIKGIRKMLGIDYVVGLAIAAAVTILSYVLAPQIIWIFSKDPAVIAYGVQYIRIACFSYVFSATSMAISYNSRAIQDLKMPTIINFVALCINGVLNYVLIFGALGAPALGVRGAAVATLIARVIELVALLGFVYSTKDHIFKARFSELFGFSRQMFTSVMKTAVPVLLTEGAWSLSVALIFAAYGLLGTTSLAVVQVANVFNELLQSFFFGVGNATAMIIGENLGKGDKEEAYKCGQRSFKITWALNIVTTLLLILLAKPIAGFYQFGPATEHLLIVSLWTMALLISIKMISYMYSVGILRAGGDTMFCMKLELITNLCVQVPLAFFAVLVLKVSLPVAMIIVAIGEVIRIVVEVPRFRSRKWINLVTEHQD